MTMSRFILLGLFVYLVGCQSTGILVEDDDDSGTDADGDGWTVEEGDCDDDDPDVNPGAEEVPCDDLDNDCDATTPDDPDDQDGDGWQACDGDCDDGDGAIHPDSLEVCEGSSDDNCDGEIDEGCHTDEFEQTSDNATDILWVVDNSCSMEDEQGNLGVQFQVLYDALTTAGVDYRIAVVTTDRAQFQGEPTIIDPETQNAVQAFAANVHVGTGGNGTERGLRFGWEALQLAVAGTAPNDGYYRPDAGLQVVFVSDEPDQSGAWEDYLADYLSLKADPAFVYLNAITGTDGASALSCTGFSGSASAGYGYVDVALATDGLLVSICDTDWSALMSELATQAIRMAAAFELSSTPIPQTLAVSVDGVLQTSGWTYEAAGNLILFDSQHVPPPGAVITVAYQV